MPLTAGFKDSSENHSNIFLEPLTPWTLEPFRGKIKLNASLKGNGFHH
jgi:hypothetical protein